MFTMFHRFDAYQTFDPLSLMTPLLVVLEEGSGGELQTTLRTTNRSLVMNHLIYSGELDSLLSRRY